MIPALLRTAVCELTGRVAVNIRREKKQPRGEARCVIQSQTPPDRTENKKWNKH